MLLLLMTVAGYAAGTLIAIFLDRLYTGAPWGGPPRLCLQPHVAPAVPLNELGGALPKPRMPEPGEDETPPAPAKTPEPLYLSDPVPWYVFTGTPGYLLARGRCPVGHKLAARLWYLPLIGAGAGAAIARYAVDGRHMALAALFGVFLLAMVGTDFERRLLPFRLVNPATVLGIALCWAWPDRAAWDSLLAGGIGAGAMLLLFVALPEFGWGDVRLMGIMGLVVGLHDLFTAVIIAVFAAGIASIVAGSLRQMLLLVLRRPRSKALMAYGPYLALGAFVGMLMA